MRLASRSLAVLAAATLVAAGLLTGTLEPQQSAAAASNPCAPSDGITPSIAVQDACGDHVMGAGALAASESSLPGSTATPSASPSPSPSPSPSASGGPRANALKTAATPVTGSDVRGFDISGFQPTTDWSGAVSAGYRFVFMKATEGTSYTSSYFNSQWVSAGAAGLLRGAYHFAQPAQSSGAAQAQYFYDNGAAMSTATPGTLPPVLDAENSGCAGLSPAQMVSWISSFMSTLQALTGRTPIIYTYQNWWNTCTGGNTALAAAYPLWVADPTPPVATQPRLPNGWSSWAFWQWGSPPFSGGGDADVFQSSSLATLTSSYGNYPRIAGTDRFATSANTAQSFLTAAKASSGSSTASATPAPGSTVYIANGWSFPDALSGGAAAGLANAPIMLVSAGSIPATVAGELSALKPKQIVILGGTTAVNASVATALQSYTASKSASSVRRIGGADRFETSADVATSTFSAGVANVYIATGTSWPDALSGSAAAAAPKLSGPMLLVQPDAIPAAVAAALSTLKPQKITILGGTTAVSDAVAGALAPYTASGSASSVVRLSGADRFATSAAIATTDFSAGVPVAYVVSGVDFPDALAAAPLSALAGGAPVLLTQDTTIPSSITSALTALKPKSIIVIGGSAAVAASVQSQLASYVAH